MLKWGGDGYGCDFCVGTGDCDGWRSELANAIHTVQRCHNGNLYANKIQVESMLEWYKNRIKLKERAMKKYDWDVQGCHTCMGGDKGCLQWKKELKVPAMFACMKSHNKYYANKEQISEMLKQRVEKPETVMPNFTEFRVNDKVYDLDHKNGYVREIKEDGVYRIKVSFSNNNKILIYTIDGRASEMDTHRSLFHGHDLEIVVKEILPLRPTEVWVVICHSLNEDKMYNKIFKGEDSKEKADHFYNTNKNRALASPVKVKMRE